MLVQIEKLALGLTTIAGYEQDQTIGISFVDILIYASVTKQGFAKICYWFTVTVCTFRQDFTLSYKTGGPQDPQSVISRVHTGRLRVL